MIKQILVAAILLSGCAGAREQAIMDKYREPYNEAYANCMAEPDPNAPSVWCARAYNLYMQGQQELAAEREYADRRADRMATVGLGMMAIGSQPSYRTTTTCTPMPGGGMNCY